MQNAHAGFGSQNNNTGSGTQYNYNGTGQNINHWQHFGVEIDSRRVLWDAIKHVGFSHQADQQFLRGECLEGTREEVLRIIHGWRIPDGWEPPICWLSGAAGVGKTSIAMTIAKSCEQDGLVESFFFFRSDPNRNHPSVLVLAIAHGLAVSNVMVREEINDRIKADWSILGARLEKQFQELVVQPVATSCARQIAANHCFAFNHPTLIIIDGLDECGDEDTQLRILSTITSAYQQFPRFPLRFLICSRPEAWIQEVFKVQPLLDATKVIVLNDEFEPDIDIERYYIHEFQDIRRGSKYRNISFPDQWPSKSDLECLVRGSDGQFAHAATAVRFVRLPFSSPLRQLRLILDNNPNSQPSQSPFHTLDSLYSMVLNANPNRDQVLPILAAILIIKDETSPDFIELLLGLAPGDVSLTLHAMHSVLDVRGRGNGISVFHTSFVDYLFDQARSGEFFIDRYTQHNFLAQQWLQGLSSSRITSHNLCYVAEPHIHTFFTKWYNFCSSLRGKPTVQVLESLRNLDSSAIFFWSLGRLLQEPERVTVTPISHSNKFSISTEDYLWHEDRHAYNWIERWLESHDDLVDLSLIKHFTNHPKCFLFQVSCNTNNIEVADIHQVVCRILLSELMYKVTPQEHEASLQHYRREGELPLLIRITECYCHCSGRREATLYQPLHCLCQLACLQTVRNLVSELLSIDLCQSIWRNNVALSREAGRIFREMLDHLLLQHCVFEAELFSLCNIFFSYTGRCSSTVMTLDESETRRMKLWGWLEACPASHIHEANTLQVSINLFFATFNSTPAFYDAILENNRDHDRFLPIAGVVFALCRRIRLDPSPAVIELLLGLSCGEVVRILQPMSEYLGFSVRGQEDGIRVCRDPYATWPSFAIDSDCVLDNFVAHRWLQAISSDRLQGYSLDQLYKTSTRVLFTKWIDFCVSLPEPTSDLLHDLGKVDLSALFFCVQVDMNARTFRDSSIFRASQFDWFKTFSKMRSWLRSSTVPVDSNLIERFEHQPRCFHLDVSFDSSHDVTNVIHWAVLHTLCLTAECELTRRVDGAFLGYAHEGGWPPFPVRITECCCPDKSGSQCSGHRAYQAACLKTAMALVYNYYPRFPTTRYLHNPPKYELHSIFKNMLDSSLLQRCAFEPELFPLCHTFLFALERHPSSWLTSSEWKERRALLLEWLQTCPPDYAREAEALRAQIVSLFPDGTLKD